MITPPPTFSWRTVLREARGLSELGRLLRWRELTARCPPGQGSVLTLPGFGAGDFTTWPLRRWLQSLGYRAPPWRLGINRGEIEQQITSLASQLATLPEPHALVGWSLGGYLAWRLAGEVVPPQIRCLVLLGTPLIGGARYTAVAEQVSKAIPGARRAGAIPLQPNHPTLVIYSPVDGIVASEACTALQHPLLEFQPVCTSHFGLGIAPESLAAIARFLGKHMADRGQSPGEPGL